MSMRILLDHYASLSASPGPSPAQALPSEVLDALSAHIAVIDRNGRIVAINEAWKQFALANGASTETTGIGCNYLEACRTSLSPENFKKGQEALLGIEGVLRRETKEFELEYPCQTPNCPRWFLLRCTPMSDNDHAVICHVDITSRKLAEKNLRQQEEALRLSRLIHREVASQLELGPVINTILNQIQLVLRSDLTVLFLTDGDSLLFQQAITDGLDPLCHDSVPHQFGKSLCQLAVQQKNAIFSFDKQTDSRFTMAECTTNGYRSSAAIPLIKGSEVLGCIAISSKRLRDFSEHSDFLEAAAHDIALSLKNALLYSQLQRFAEDIENQLLERTRLEKVLLQDQKLDAVAHLAGGIAHDFNNILAAIMGYSELIRKKTEDADAIKYLQGTLKACSRAKDLIQQILTFSRKSKVNLMPLDLRFVLKETLPLIRASLPDTVTVLDRLDTIAASTIRGNPTELQQVFINLCANGVQAMRGTGGMLIVRLADVLADQHLRERCPQLELNRRYVMLSIRDTGTGIAAEHMGSIFEPYFSTKIQEKGTGLGLAVVDGIVRNHQGGVIVESFPGHGTTFSLYFPFVDREEMATVPQIRKNEPNAAPHILIVDDEAAILQILRKALENKGYTTTCSQFAKEAITLFRRSPGSYDLVLLDLTMPEVRGDRLAEIIKKIRWDIPIVLCSGYTERLIQPIATNHVDRILRKPVPYAELTATLEEMLAGKIPAGS